jgi:hypothetical protein
LASISGFSARRAPGETTVHSPQPGSGATAGARYGAEDELADQQESALRMAEGYQAKVAELEKDIREKVQWAMNLNTEFEQERASAVAALLHLDEEKRHLEQQLAMVRASRWVRLGREFGLGPR